MAESGFDPNAGSPAGAQGIAQFMPGTAASYGLTNPFDPVAAIDAQAHLMSDLLRQFGSPELALAAYNAGPGAVEPCNCIPPYPETQAYVTRILALLDGAGALICRASKCGWWLEMVVLHAWRGGQDHALGRRPESGVERSQWERSGASWARVSAGWSAAGRL